MTAYSVSQLLSTHPEEVLRTHVLSSYRGRPALQRMLFCTHSCPSFKILKTFKYADDTYTYSFSYLKCIWLKLRIMHAILSSYRGPHSSACCFARIYVRPLYSFFDFVLNKVRPIYLTGISNVDRSAWKEHLLQCVSSKPKADSCHFVLIQGPTRTPTHADTCVYVYIYM